MENYILLLLTSAIDAYIWLLVSKIFLREKYHFKVCLGGWRNGHGVFDGSAV